MQPLAEALSFRCKPLPDARLNFNDGRNTRAGKSVQEADAASTAVSPVNVFASRLHVTVRDLKVRTSRR
jgi:hypothetical protein